jgi:hypothetical protein
VLQDDVRGDVGNLDGAVAVGWREADRQLRRIAKRRAALDAEEARWLVIAKRERAHVELGFGSFVEYVGRIGNCGRSAAYERVRVAEWLDASPASFEALATGVASFCAIRDISRIATPETEPLWLEAIENKTSREIETLLAGRKHGDRPDDHVEPTLMPKVCASSSCRTPTRCCSRRGG